MATPRLALLSLTILVSGCATDSILGRKRIVGAPVTAFESVEIARQSKMSLAAAQEVDLVENVIYYRTMYSQSVRALGEYYKSQGYASKVTWTNGELDDLSKVRAYHYLLDSELPRLDLIANESISEADALFAKAKSLAEKAGHGVPAVYNQGQMIQALQMFKQLIREYPSSDKIDDAAFFCGELHKEYFNDEEAIAVRWYERAWTWDPATPHPARFQAAIVYDYRLHDRARALELYRATIAAEPKYRSHRHLAMERIKQLTEGTPSESIRVQPVAETETSAQTAPQEVEQPSH